MMANCKSAEKRVRVIRTKTLENSIKRSELKTAIRKFTEAVASKSESANELLQKCFKSIDKAVSKNILHKNTGARRKFKLAKMLNAVEEAK